MDRLPLFFDAPSLEAINSIKQSSEVVADGLFYIPSSDSSELKLIILIGSHLVQYEVRKLSFRTILKAESER